MAKEVTLTSLYADLEPLVMGTIQDVLGDREGATGLTPGSALFVIRLYDVSAAKVRDFAPTAAGLAAAVSGAAAGDTILLPAGTFGGNVAVIAGVEICGIGVNSILSGIITNAGILSQLKLTGTLTDANGQTIAVHDVGALSVLVGGGSNRSEDAYTTVGGFNNRLLGAPLATTCFGMGNEVHSSESMVAGRDHVDTGSQYNAIFGDAHVVGGDYNILHGEEHIVAGAHNAVFGKTSTVAGSFNVAGGLTQVVSGSYSVAFGYDNEITANLCGVLSGSGHEITAQESTIVGGSANEISAALSVILGGTVVVVSGQESLGWGNFPTITHNGAAVFADGTFGDPSFPSEANNEFAIRSRGGFRVVTDITVPGVTTYAVGVYTGAELRFYEGLNYVGFEPPALAADQIWVLPDADGNANDVMITSGGGVLSWADVPTLAGMVWITNANVANLITDTDTVTIGSATAGGKLFIDGDADEIQLQIQAVAGQAVNLMELQRSDTTLTAGFDERGVLFSYAGGVASNLFAGDNAGSLTAAGGNVALGDSAGRLLDAGGTYNVLIGSNAGYELTSGNSNVYIGRQAGMYGQDATGNTFVGYYAGRGTAAYDAYFNTFYGYNSGYSNSTGDGNIFLGSYAGWRQTASNSLLIIDNAQRADVATELSNALVYGQMEALVADQWLRINGEIRGSYGAKIGDGGTTNYAQFAIDGELTLVGTARVKKELVVPLDGIGKGVTAPTLTRLTNTIGYAFGIGDDGYMQFEIPHDWDSSTALSVLIHCYNTEAYATNSGEVQWQATWSAIPEDASEAVDGATHTGTLDSGDIDLPAIAKALQEVELGTIAAASLAYDDTVCLLVSRVALDGGNNPTAGEPVITRMEVEYIANKLGEAT